MNETNNNQKKYEVVAKYIKDISFEIKHLIVLSMPHKILVHMPLN